MNSSSIQFKHFTPPPLEPIWAPKSFVFLMLNWLTLGTYGAGEAVSKAYRAKELKIIQSDLHKQAVELNEQWAKLEQNLSTLLEDLTRLKEDDIDGPAKMRKDFQKSLESLRGRTIQPINVEMKFSNVALGTISFFGQLFANILTLGFYGVYQNYSLKNKVKVLEAGVIHFQHQFHEELEAKVLQIQKIIKFAEQSTTLREEVNKVRGDLKKFEVTDAGVMYQELLKAEKTIKSLQEKQEELNKKQDELQKEISALRVEKVKVEQGKSSLEKDFQAVQRDISELRERYQQLINTEYRMRQDRDRWQKDYHVKDAELAALRIKQDKEMEELRKEVRAAQTKAERVRSLESEVVKLKEATKSQPEVAKLVAQLGPIPSPYTRRQEDGVIDGAIDIVDIKDTTVAKGMLVVKKEKENLDSKVLAAAKVYRQRYSDDKLTAADIAAASFNFALDTLLDMGAKGNKIKLNDSDETYYSPGAQAVYRYMALDLIEGAKLFDNGCEGMGLKINNHVVMYPSYPEKVLSYEPDETDGKVKPVVVTRYNLRDDFTPSEKTVGQNGVDCVSAKWILSQLTKEEKEYLFTMLMSPAIENTHPDYIEMLQYKENGKAERVKLVLTAHDLIRDIGFAMEKKFQSTIFASLWGVKAKDETKSPFIKKELEKPSTKDIEAALAIGKVESKKDKFVDWTLDVDVLGDQRLLEDIPRQPDFADLIVSSQKKYKTAFDHMQHDLVKHPEKVGKTFKRLKWDDIDQYNIIHQMIGANAHFVGGQRCLFSNLLAILVTNASDLTVGNVLQLRRAMAAYLDKIYQARLHWELLSDKESSEAKRLEELAKLSQDFEKAIYNTYQCDVPSYQAWLRQEKGAAKIDINKLTPLEIMLGAYTIGVKIGLLAIDVKVDGQEVDYPAVVDQYGRIVPDEKEKSDFCFYGPNTKEYLLMAYNDVQASYYALFPKLRLARNAELDSHISQKEYNRLVKLQNYWKNTDMHKKK